MLLIKIWGSLIAPKNASWINEKYLKEVSSFFLNFDNIFIAHWTWNIGHGRVKNLINLSPDRNLADLLIEDYKNWRKILDEYFAKIDEYFKWFTRIDLETFISNSKNDYSKWKFIIWWDVTPDGKIISSDDIISQMMKNNFVGLVLILTDVNGVFDSHWKVIPKITRDNIDKIKFCQKENDVTWWMHQKVMKILDSGKKAIICNWRDLENVKNWIEKGRGVWTVIY